MQGLALAALLSLPVPVAAAERPAASVPLAGGPLADPGEGFLVGDGYRYGELVAPLRALADVAAIPAHVRTWGGGDWGRLALWSGAIAALMVPAGGGDSLDLRIDRWLRAEVNPHVPEVWTVPMQAALWSGLAVGGLGTWGWAAASGHGEIAQGLSLMGEALVVTQAYHVAIKLTLGREGPGVDAASEPRIHGPGVGFALAPSGAPSGHSATLFSLLSAGFAWFEPPGWAQVGGVAVAASLVAFHVVDHKHYASDSLWGAAMGWYVGRWVVDHRAARPGSSAAAGRPGRRHALFPMALEGGGGLTLVGEF